MADEAMSVSMKTSLDEVRRYDHDRFLTLLFAPMPQRLSLIALYAFNLEIARVAENVTEPMMGHIRLQWWRETLEGLPNGETRGHAVAAAVAEADLKIPRLQALIDARERDLSEDVFEDVAMLDSYAEKTSAAVMDIAARALGGEEKADAAADAIRHAGIAYALTGLLRALPVHASQGRLTMPADVLLRCNVDPHTVLAGEMTEGLRAVIQDVADHARSHLSAARMAHFDPQLLPALMPASLCDRYLDMMTAPGFDPFRDRTDVPAFRRQLRLLGRNFRKKI
ncbi:putative phytoene synthase [Parvibaculum lavamentivorans DS-1]|uniref:Putative phytoene synthase n=1 Tax=Parvibaculum lavamentivorans (strain DS-1 / DSM 13023 / NCIMB 13966) TaxID=402881 RepID=A7HXL4_PARL1|nr:phytoene/squalene synthase family protein [Parvibaculum lavamentivorans]ABS64647.1 putative phytoene synthase [Parvibaculum lavamentivorans DS-1]